MFAARLPALACGLSIVAFTLAHEAGAVEQAPVRAKTVLVVGSAAAVAEDNAALTRVARPAVSAPDESAEDWTDSRRLLLGFAALFVFLAYRRRETD